MPKEKKEPFVSTPAGLWRNNYLKPRLPAEVIIKKTWRKIHEDSDEGFSITKKV